MRCPKCGYISFDQEETCGKCSTSLADVNAKLIGTGLRVQEAFFLASVIGQTPPPPHAEEGVEFDLAMVDERPESELEIAEAEDAEEIPVVDLSSLGEEGEKQQEAAAEEGISFTMPGEEPEPLAEPESTEEVAVEQGTIDFTFEPETQTALELEEEEAEDASEAEAGLADLVLEEAAGEAEQSDGIAFEPAEETLSAPPVAEGALPELDLQMADEAEPEVDFDGGLLPEIEQQDLQSGEGAEVKMDAAQAGPGLNLDIDVELEDEPAEEEMVFNLEDIDMSDLMIEESGEGQAKAVKPEDVAHDLESYLSGGQDEDEAGIPMDLTMEDINLNLDAEVPHGEKDKKSEALPDIEL